MPAAAANPELAVWPDPEPEFLTRQQAGELAHVTAGTITRWVLYGYLGDYGTPGRRLIRTAELRRLLDEGPHRPRGPQPK